MTRKLERFLECLESTDLYNEPTRLCDSLREIYGIEHATYLATNLNGHPYYATTYDPRWSARYQEENYVNIDPVVLSTLRYFQPMEWRQLDWSSKRSRAFFHEAIEFGVGNQGFTIPVRGPNGQHALFAINHRSNDHDWNGYIHENVHDFMLISHYVHQHVLKLVNTEADPTYAELSPREQDVLKYLGIGFSRSQTAEKLQISEHTLRVYIDSARYKLGALNTTHAVALAVARGVISV